MIPQNVIDLFDEFTHGGLDRRDFMHRLAGIVGGSGAAAAMLPHLEVGYAHAERVNADAAGLQETYVAYPGASGEVRAYLARPAGSGPFPAVMVIHENRGLNPHIEDVARRAAAD